MEIYELMAWLPGETVFYGKNQEGKIGLLSTNGFIEAPGHYVDSAITKWGFMDLRPLKIIAHSNQLPGLTNHLSSLV